MSKEQEKYGLGPKKPIATDEQIIRALETTGGQIAKAARMLGYAPGTLRKKICACPKLKEAKNEIRETHLDRAEDKLNEHIYEKDSLPALLEYLRAAGGERGYGHNKTYVEMNGQITHTAEDAMMDALVRKFEEGLIDVTPPEAANEAEKKETETNTEGADGNTDE